MLACLLGEQNGEWTLRFCKNICFWLLFWVGQPEWEGGHGVNSTVIRPVELSAGLEGVAGKASKPEDFGFDPAPFERARPDVGARRERSAGPGRLVLRWPRGPSSRPAWA